MKNAVTKKIGLFTLFFLLISPLLPGQFFSSQAPDIWLKPELAPLHPDSVLIGNYHPIDLNSTAVKRQLEALSGSREGSLFLVLKPSTQPDSADILVLGDLTFNRKQAAISGSAIAYNQTIGRQPIILRLSYSRPPLNRRPSRRVFLAPSNYVAELIHFPSRLNQEEIRVVESYLALKYSINITANEEPRWRHYLAGSLDRLWDYQLDHYYDESVLALGRLDSLGFYQSQTCGPADDDLLVSLGASASPGSMPAVNMADKSLLILARAPYSFREQECAGARNVSLWKLKIYRWQSAEYDLQLEFKAAGKLPANAYLLGMGQRYQLELQQEGDLCIISIPLTAAMEGKEYLLYWQQENLLCNPLVEVMQIDCDQAQSPEIVIKSAASALPAQLRLIGQTNHQLYRGLLQEEFTRLQHIPAGGYQLLITREAQLLYDQWLEISDCSSLQWSPTDLADPDQEIEELPLPLISSQANSKGKRMAITAYPNPSRFFEPVLFELQNLQGIALSVEIFDARGRRIGQQDLLPKMALDYFSYLFPHKGMYLLKFNSKIYSENVAVIIN